MLAIPLPIHGSASVSPSDLMEQLEILDYGGMNDDMLSVWEELSEPASSPHSTSEATSPISIMSSSESDDSLQAHVETPLKASISPPANPLPPITIIYQLPTKPKNRNPYILLEEDVIEVHAAYTIPMKLQLYLPGKKYS